MELHFLLVFWNVCRFQEGIPPLGFKMGLDVQFFCIHRLRVLHNLNETF